MTDTFKPPYNTPPVEGAEFNTETQRWELNGEPIDEVIISQTKDI